VFDFFPSVAVPGNACLASPGRHRIYRVSRAVDPYQPEMLYVQLAAILREQIRSGELEPLDWIPSEPSLQAAHNVSRGTVRKALRLLAEEQRIRAVPGRGSYVLEDQPQDQPGDQDQADNDSGQG
jgi:DNA-binding GntR family transcriptional regulator